MKNEERKREEEEERKKWKQHYLNGNDYFNGIFNYLERKYGKDIHQQGIITITASSSCTNRPDDVINYEWNSYWRSNGNNLGEWWQINFKKMKVKMNGYSIKTYNASANWIHLMNWIIEGKNDGEEWKEIDRRENNYDLNGPSYQHYYSIPEITKPFQYFRIKCIGRDHYNNSHSSCYYYLQFTNIEIYGEIYEESNN